MINAILNAHADSLQWLQTGVNPTVGRSADHG
jgi:hypothetical protein